MAKVFSVGSSLTGGPAIIFNLKTQLKLGGWTVTRSSDGTTFNSSGDQITTAVTGAGGMDNNNAWFVIRQPAAVGGAQRMLMFMRGNSGADYWTIQYSRNGVFTGGSATVPATATDSQYIHGVDVVGGASFYNAIATRVSFMYDNASPYGWWVIAHNSGTTTFNSLLMMDPLTSGSSNALDDDTYVFVSCGSSSTYGNTIYDSVSNPNANLVGISSPLGSPGCVGWYKRNLTGATWVRLAMGILNFHGLSVYHGQGQNGYATKDDLFPIIYGRSGGNGATTQPFIKGTSTLAQMVSTHRASQDTLTVSTTRDYLHIGPGMVLNWNGSVPTL